MWCKSAWHHIKNRNGWYWIHDAFVFKLTGNLYLSKVRNDLNYDILGYLKDLGCSVTYLQPMADTD